MTFKDYYRLTKPGIVYSNLLTGAAGFFLASHHAIRFETLFGMLFGLGFVIASACVFNNYIDRSIDAQMARTKDRPLVSGKISPQAALIFGTILITLGVSTLIILTNYIALFVALAGFGIYLGLYTPSKRGNIYSTHVGALSGATPPVVGYVAVTHSLDMTALMLFLILAFWQMPHFFAIAMFRMEDYKAARIPLWPIIKGFRSAKIQMLVFVALFAGAALALPSFARLQKSYLIVMSVISIFWFLFSLAGFWTHDERKWARTMFFYSLLVLLAWSLLLMIS